MLADHLAYISSLLSKHEWLAGDQLTYADLGAAAHLSTAEFLRDIPVARRRSREEMVCADAVAALFVDAHRSIAIHSSDFRQAIAEDQKQPVSFGLPRRY